jgi:DNA topoisomerase-6 subunit B
VESSKSVPEYVKQVAISNPYADITFDGPNGKIEFPRKANKLPPLPKEIKPHPYGIELGILRRMLKSTKSRTVISFLKNDFSRVGTGSANDICKLAGIDPKISPQRLEIEDTEKLFKSMQKAKLVRPPTNCLSPLGEDLLIQGLKKEYNAEFFTATTRPPEVYRGNPFQVEAAIAYGGELPPEGSVEIMRITNRVPLLYQEGDCAITKSINSTDWRRYGLSQSGKNTPVGPAVIIVHLASVWVPYISESKQAIAAYPIIMKEIKLALQDAGRKLKRHVSGKRKAEIQRKRIEMFDRYLPEIAKSVAKLTEKKPEPILTGLKEIVNKDKRSGKK